MSDTATLTDAGATDSQAESSQAQNETETATENQEAISLEEAKKLRSEARSLRHRLREFEQTEEARKQSELSETQRLQTELERIKAENSELLSFRQQTAIRDAVTDAARDPQLGAKRPEALHKLVSHDALKFDDDGNLDAKSLATEIARIKADFPELFYVLGGSANGGDGARNGATPQTVDMNAAMRRMMGRI